MSRLSACRALLACLALALSSGAAAPVSAQTPRLTFGAEERLEARVREGAEGSAAFHPSYPVGALISVARVDGSQQALVNVAGRSSGAGLELSPAAGALIGLAQGQTANVRVTYLGQARAPDASAAAAQRERLAREQALRDLQQRETRERDEREREEAARALAAAREESPRSEPVYGTRPNDRPPRTEVLVDLSQREPQPTSAPATSTAGALPNFPWPPPRPSAQSNLPRTVFVRAGAAQPSLSAVGSTITASLARAGYSEYSYYRVPGGFALVARLERINPDGTPEATGGRFTPPDATQPFSLATYLQQLFFAPEGYYRLIAFVVTNQPFRATGEVMTSRDANQLLRDGANRLTSDFAAQPFTEDHVVTALVYEFQKRPGNGDVATLNPGRLDARAHLVGAGLGQLSGMR